MAKMNSHLRMVANVDGAAILNARSGKLSALNPTGAYVWEGLERGEDVEVIVKNLARETGMSLEVVERDVRAFVAALKEQGLVS
jgi:hypothetical protein